MRFGALFGGQELQLGLAALEVRGLKISVSLVRFPGRHKIKHLRSPRLSQRCKHVPAVAPRKTDDNDVIICLLGDLCAATVPCRGHAGSTRGPLLVAVRFTSGSEARIVRLSDETYSTGARCFFPSEDVRQDEALPRVHLDVYSSGKSKTQQENARKLLEALGVRLVGEAEQIEAILKQRYTAERLKPQKQDLKRFINLVEKDSTQVSLFRDFFIFEGRDGKWTKPADTFLDEPFLDTGLTAYYDAFGERAARVPLAVTYADFGISLKRIAKFAETIGSQTQLEIAQVGCRSNPQYPYLLAVPGERYTSPIDRDFVVPGLQTHLAKPTVSIARLIWRTMCALPSYPDRLKAAYRKSGSGGTRYADSLLVDQLRKAAWIASLAMTWSSPGCCRKRTSAGAIPASAFRLAPVCFGSSNSNLRLLMKTWIRCCMTDLDGLLLDDRSSVVGRTLRGGL